MALIAGDGNSPEDSANL